MSPVLAAPAAMLTLLASFCSPMTESVSGSVEVVVPPTSSVVSPSPVP